MSTGYQGISSVLQAFWKKQILSVKLVKGVIHFIKSNFVGTTVSIYKVLLFIFNPISSVRKMAILTFKILQQMLQDFPSVHDHFMVTRP